MKELHMFAICAYKDSPYLEACIRSVLGQNYPSKAIICTSTPSSYIEGLARKYSLPCYVREGKSNIRDDWNFAYEKADARLVTIAHQDDCYRAGYVRALVNAFYRFPDMTLFTTDAVTVKDGRPQPWERLRLVKKFLRLGLRSPYANHWKWVKKSALVLGNAVCCPACTYRKELLEEPLFTSDFQFVLDWDNLLTLAGKPGRFICEEEPLVFHRIHREAATAACMEDHRRTWEEQEIFKRIWPEAAAKLLTKGYRGAYGAYGSLRQGAAKRDER